MLSVDDSCGTAAAVWTGSGEAGCYLVHCGASCDGGEDGEVGDGCEGDAV